MFPTSWMFVSVAMGLTAAANAVVSQYIGADNERAAQRAVGQTVLLAVAVATTLATVGYLASTERIVASPAPEECHDTREFYCFIGITRVVIRTEIDRPVEHHFMNDFPRAVVEDLAYVSQRSQVVFDRFELSDGDARECRVFAVGGEQPG